MKESGEMYLETILIISKKKSAVRAIDVAEDLGYSKPSVSRAMGILKSEEYIKVDKNGFITFTKKGRETAEKIYERHQVISSLLMRLGVDENTAMADACKIEHDISDKSFAAIKEHIEKYDN